MGKEDVRERCVERNVGGKMRRKKMGERICGDRDVWRLFLYDKPFVSFEILNLNSSFGRQLRLCAACSIRGYCNRRPQSIS